jgi:hypothetical protein
MLKDRIIEIGSKRILLPEFCFGPSGNFSVAELRAILSSDRHSLLVTGEPGTGKEVLADCVMHFTKRPKAKCQRINCAGLDRNLVGSELFGHKKGAYTGADSARDGLLKACDGGIVVLDEIGWLPDDLQARLLRFMETGDIRPLGSDRVEVRADVRVVAATNKDPGKCLIPDLRQRFDFEVALPALRSRDADVLWFLCEDGFLGKEDVYTGVSLRTLVGMLTCPWVGNIRELKKYCQHKTLLRPIEELYGEDRHILDDFSLVDSRVVDRWVGFAGFALAAAESQAKKIDGFLDDAGVLRVLGLLVGLFSGIKAPLWTRDKDFVAILPLGLLRAAVSCELSGLGNFDFDLSIENSILVEHPNLEWRSDADLIVGPDSGVVDFSGAFVRLGYYVESYRKLDSTFKEIVVEDSGHLKKVFIRPSKAFVDKIGFAGPDGLLFAVPDAPSSGGCFISVLDQLGINDLKRDICLLCNQQKSNGDIAKALKISKSVVSETLANLRSSVALRPYLPIQHAGRKRKLV